MPSVQKRFFRGCFESRLPNAPRLSGHRPFTPFPSNFMKTTDLSKLSGLTVRRINQLIAEKILPPTQAGIGRTMPRLCQPCSTTYAIKTHPGHGNGLKWHRPGLLN